MSELDIDLWRRVSPHLDEALDLEGDARDAFIRNLDASEPQVARELRGLLALDAEVKNSGFFERTPLSPADLVIGRKIGAYTVERLLGQGGMGSVWLARRSDEKFEGKAAIKLLERCGLGPLALAQIRHEANLLARLSHSRIARLFDAGARENGQPFLVLEYVEGMAIDRYFKEHALSLTDRLRKFLEVLDAVAYAHSQLVVHGDLKPSNVLVTEDGAVKLIDFGVASLQTDTLAMTLGELGAAPKGLTPGYASPEQLRGEPLSAAADVYALGVLLHVIVTARHPLGDVRSTTIELICAATTENLPAASTYIVNSTEQRRIRGDLDAIIARALARDPPDRYAATADLAADIRCYLGNFPVRARPSSRIYAARKFAQRHRGGVASALLTLIALIGAVFITTMQMLDARHQRDFARRQFARAESLNELTSYVLTDAAPGGKPLTVNELLGRAGHLLERQHSNETDRTALLTSIGRQYDTQDEDDSALKYLGLAYQPSRHVNDVSVRARAACAYAAMLAKRDTSSRPETMLAEGLNELPKDPEFAFDRSFCLTSGDGIALDRGNTTLAIERSEGALKALSEVPFYHELADLRAKANLAEAYRASGRYRESIVTFEELWPRLVAQGHDDTATAGTWLNNWGVAVAQMGRPMEAEKLLRQSVNIHRSNDAETSISPMLMTNYAQQLLDLHRLPEAQDFAERALAGARRAGDEVVINQTLLRLARIYRAENQFAHSFALLDEVEPRLHAALPPTHFAFIALDSERSQTLELSGDTARALELADQAVRTCEERATQGDACGQYLANLVWRRASVELTRGQLAPAERDARRALEMHLSQSRSGEFSQWTGEAYLTLARCLMAEGRPEDARRFSEQASSQLKMTLGPGHPDTLRAVALTDRQ